MFAEFRLLLPCALLAHGLPAQSPPVNVFRLRHFPPGQVATHGTPGVTPAADFSGATSHRDPSSGREFAVACADNGILLVDAVPPAHSRDTLAGVAMDSWFFQDLPPSRWRSVASFRDRVYAVAFGHAGIRRFKIDPAATGAARVQDLGYSNTGDFPSTGPRTTVDPEHGHLFLCSVADPSVTGGVAMYVYDLFDHQTMTLIDPPVLLAVWPQPVFDAFLRDDRAYLAETPNRWRILGLAGLRTNPPANPRSWAPPFTSWINTLPFTLSHNSYLPPDAKVWFTTDETPGYMTGRTLGPTAQPLNNGSMQEPGIVGWYLAPEPVHAINGIGKTGYLAHFSAGFHLLDLSTNPGPTANYALLASYDTSPLVSLLPGFGAWTVDPHQDSGVVYVTDSQQGLFLLRVDAGHLNRFGPGTGNGSGVPRIRGDTRPPRLGFQYEFQVSGMKGQAMGALVLSAFEDPGWLAGSPTQIGGATVLVDLATSTTTLFQATDAGEWQHCESIPTTASLVGARLFAQVFEGTATGFAASRGTWFGIAP